MPVSEDNQAEIIGLNRQTLLVRHVNGDRTAFPELVQHYRKRVYAYLVRCGVDEGMRDDLFQEIFIKIHKSASSFKSNKTLDPWVFTIVANTVRAHYRKQRVRKLVYQDVPESDTPETAPDAYDMVEAGETADWLKKELKKLPFNQREILLLNAMGNMDQKTVATTLGVPLNTVKTNLRRARTTLAKALARRKGREA